MSAPPRNCIFCQESIPLHETWMPPDLGGMGYAGEPTHIYMCDPCKSQQDYDVKTDQLTYYNFRIGLYRLQFHPNPKNNGKYKSFRLGKDPPEDIGNTETILHLDFLPDYTPQNTTEERIQLLL